jgi:dTDP-4-dehydrorhamnose 3,5-epimerase
VIVRDTALDGVLELLCEPNRDERGSLTRTFDRRFFAERGLQVDYEQHSLVENSKRGTLRGLHFQEKPHDEIKLLQCVRGRLYDVIVDIRPESPGYGKWIGINLDAQRPALLYVPRGFAHGYQTLEDDTAVLYLIDRAYVSEAARGYDPFSPHLAIRWPLPVSVMSSRDRDHPTFE